MKIFYWITVVTAIIMGFLFPAELIDAIKLPKEKDAQYAREKACATFGVLIICLILLCGN